MDRERPPRVCFAMLYYAREHAELDPARYLEQMPIHRALPDAIAALGHEVHLVHLWSKDAELVDGCVHHHFVAPSRGARRLAPIAGRLASRDPGLYESAGRAIARVRALRPDIVHFHGLTLTLNLWLLRRALPAAVPLVLHYHGGYPSRRRLPRRLQRDNLERAARLCFTTRSHAAPFLAAGASRDPCRVVELMETSTTFRRQDRQRSRALTDMAGEPVCLWAGRLDPIKDPLTALRGFVRILESRPGAQLYLHYLTDPLLPELQAFVSGSPGLGAHVHFRGRAPFERMEAIYSSADFLLQASRREFSGCAVLEAMACGAIPVVTDIPSFHAMTDGGRLGVLFPAGDDIALAEGVLALSPGHIPGLSVAVEDHFARELSFDAMARRLAPVYAELLDAAWGAAT